jgi:hypothetical protein
MDFSLLPPPGNHYIIETDDGDFYLSGDYQETSVMNIPDWKDGVNVIHYVENYGVPVPIWVSSLN